MTEIFKYLSTSLSLSLSLSLSEDSDYVQQMKHQYFMKQSKQNFPFGIFLPLFRKIASKKQNFLFKVMFHTKNNSNVLNTTVIISFSVLDRKYPFWANLFQKIKIVCLDWNLVPSLIWMCWIQWCNHFFCYRQEVPFLGKFYLKSQTCLFQLKFVT